MWKQGEIMWLKKFPTTTSLFFGDEIGDEPYKLLIFLAPAIGIEPTVHGIKTRGYCYQELSGFS